MSQDDGLLTSESAVYRVVDDKLLVVELGSGEFYYFSKETKSFLDHFKHPCSLDSYLGIDESRKHEDYCEAVEDLVEKNILVRQAVVERQETCAPAHKILPKFLGKAEIDLGSLNFFY